MNILHHKFKFHLQLFLIYLICHGGIFFILNSIYWDDWTLFNTSEKTIFSTFKQAGGSFFNFTAILHTTIIPFGIWIYRILTFLLFFLTGLLFFKILLNNKRINADTAKFIVILFLVLPFNSARVALIDFPYTIGYFLFFLAWRFKKIRLFSLPVFFFSFNVNSLPFLYLLVIFDLYFDKADDINVVNVKSFLVNKIDYILLPCAFFFIKYKYFVTSGLYNTYNSNFQIKNLVLTPIRQFIDFTHLDLNLFFLVCCILILNIFKPFNHIVIKSNYSNIYIAILAIVLAVFPYWILGLTPSFFDWSSRHQLLMPLGLSLIITYFLSKTETNRYIYFTFFLSFSIVINATNYFNFWKDWNKQKELISVLKINPSLKDKKLILVKDNTLDYNALNRPYRFYEWNGLFKYAYNNESRFVLNYSEADLYKNGYFNDFFNEFGNAKGYVRINLKDATVVIIDKIESKTTLGKFKDIIRPKFLIYTCQ